MLNVGNLVAPWKPGQTGNPNGRPIGSRSAFSQSYVRDFQTVWDESGIEPFVRWPLRIAQASSWLPLLHDGDVIHIIPC